MEITKENNQKKKGLFLHEYVGRRAESKRLMGKDSTAGLF